MVQGLLVLSAALLSLSLPAADCRPSLGPSVNPAEEAAPAQEEPQGLGFQWAGGSPLPPASHPKPLIGILSQPGDGDGGYAPRLTRCPRSPAPGSKCAALKSPGNGNNDIQKRRRHNGNDSDVSYIAASYIKWVESAGARPVAILYDEPEEDMLKVRQGSAGPVVALTRCRNSASVRYREERGACTKALVQVCFKGMTIQEESGPSCLAFGRNSAPSMA